MVEIGKINKLIVSNTEGYSTYLHGDGGDDILLKERHAADKYRDGDQIEAFIYVDREQQLVATSKKPKVLVGEFATLRVVSTSSAGAFLDWGLDDDLLVPKSEQLVEMKEGRSYLVYVFISEKSHRITASSKLVKHLSQEPARYSEGEEVELMVYSRSKLGYNAIINRAHLGVIYQNEIFQKVTIGQNLRGFIKKVREDGKIDLSLQQSGYQQVDDLAQQILTTIQGAGGEIAITDKSAPEEIYASFGVSKKVFKKAIGALYKQRIITITPHSISYQQSKNC